MDEEIERLVIAVRADTAGFAKDVADMKGQLDGPLAAGMERAGSALETSLGRAIRRGSLDLQDLKSVALSVMADIAEAAISSGLGSLFGGAGGPGGTRNGGLLGIGTSLLGAALGAPGRATGGPVTAGRAYHVGEQGPELFVPTSAGRIERNGASPGSPDIRLTINISDNGHGSAPDQVRRSSRQVARAVRSALAGREG